MAKKFKPNDKKLAELILYVASRSEEDSTYSATKLNKLLFFADFFSYSSLGKPITGHRYQKLPNGPAPIALIPVVQKMVARGDCEWIERPYFGRVQKRLTARRGADLSWMSEEVRALVDQLIDELWERSARDINDLSHDLPGWQAVGMQEEIPYETVFVLPPRPLSVGELKRARELANP